MIYDKIYDFCKVRNKGNCFKNGSEPTPRVQFLINLLESEGIEYELDVFEEEYRKPPKINTNLIKRYRHLLKMDKKSNKEADIKTDFDDDEIDFDNHMHFLDDEEDDDDDTNIEKNKYFNIIMRGSSNKMVVAHHDVNNPTIDNANDNSASVINVIATKKLRPEINAVLLDGEEFGGIGSGRLSKQIKNGDFGHIEWVLNYELSGKGGKYFFIGNYPGKLSDRIVKIFNCPIVFTPFNDSVIFRKYGIDSTVINPVPPIVKKEGDDKKKDRFSFREEVLAPDGTPLDLSILSHCHSPKDTVDTISPADMKEFVEEVILKIID